MIEYGRRMTLNPSNVLIGSGLENNKSRLDNEKREGFGPILGLE